MLDTVPSAARWREAREAADRLTQAFDKPPIPAYEIAEQNGVDVVFADFGKHADTASGFCNFAKAQIFVNREDSLERKTFTIAHELGHWLLHRDLFLADPARYPVLPRYTNPNRYDPLEKEANHFAANLLVPDHLLSRHRNAPVALLAKIFMVSPTMMGFRVRNA